MGLWSTNLGKFILLCALVNFTATMAGPFFSPYMLRDLRYSYITYTIMNSAAGLATIAFMTWWGKRMDRAGSIKVLKITALLVPFVPIGWALSRNFWWLIFVQAFSGFAWAGFQLSSSVFIYDGAPKENRTRHIALYNALIFLGVSLGSLTGGVLAPLLPPFMGSYFLSIFMVSGLARLVVVLFFLPRMKEVRSVPVVSAGEIMFGDFSSARFKRLVAVVRGHLPRWRK